MKDRPQVFGEGRELSEAPLRLIVRKAIFSRASGRLSDIVESLHDDPAIDCRHATGASGCLEQGQRRVQPSVALHTQQRLDPQRTFGVLQRDDRLGPQLELIEKIVVGREALPCPLFAISLH
ncbi:MAG: hypothetical protein R3E68_12900 [Burkholderiaceae bacterium]